MWSKLLFALLLPLASPAVAQDAAKVEEAVTETPEAGKWSVVVTPRLQYALFLPDVDASDLEGLTSGGVSVTARAPDGRFAATATFLFGKGSGDYRFDNGIRRSTYDHKGDRKEFSLLAEFTPRETNVSVLAGYHRFNATASEMLRDGGLDFEANSYRFQIDALEVGVRLASRLGENSRHAISAQFSMGLGRGRFSENEAARFGGVTTGSVRSDSGQGALGDIALGYNYFLTDRMTIGARARGYIFYVDAPGSFPIFAVTPEANASYRF